MATFPEVCFWELSYVNVPTVVNLKSYSMNVATRYVLPPHLFDYTALLVRQLLDMTNHDKLLCIIYPSCYC